MTCFNSDCCHLVFLYSRGIALALLPLKLLPLQLVLAAHQLKLTGCEGSLPLLK